MTALLTPAYRLTIGKHRVDTTVEPKASATTDLIVTLDIDALPDTAKLTLGQVGGIAPALDDTATIELGYADNGGFIQVFTGTVDTFDANLLVRRVAATSTARALMRLFVDQSYEGRTAGQIVRDLAGRARIDTGAIDDGIGFPVYVIESRKSALAHIRELAALCGVDAYVDAEGRLVFQAFTQGRVIHDVDYAKQVLSLGIDRLANSDVNVKAFGESPMAQAGSEAWGWLTKDFSPAAGSAGSGPLPIVVERSALRTASAAATAASAALRAVQRRAVHGRVRMPGRPEVKLGDALRVRDVPRDGFNDSYQVRRVVHRITKPEGFTTTVDFAAIPSEALR
jgi:phage protein D